MAEPDADLPQDNPPRQMSASLSYRVAGPRHCLKTLKERSTKFASLVGLGVEVHRSSATLTTPSPMPELVVWFGNHRGDPSTAQQLTVRARGEKPRRPAPCPVSVGAVLALSAGSDETLNPAADAVADPPTVTDFSIRAEGDGCVFDPDRGGLVYKGLTIESKSTDVLEVSFYVLRDSLDDILPGGIDGLANLVPACERCKGAKRRSRPAPAIVDRVLDRDHATLEATASAIEWPTQYDRVLSVARGIYRGPEGSATWAGVGRSQQLDLTHPHWWLTSGPV